jgi:hypothetical protein
MGGRSPVSPPRSPGEAEPGANSARVVTPPCGAEASLSGGSRSISKRAAPKLRWHCRRAAMFLEARHAADHHGANDQQRPGGGLWDRRQRCQGQGGAARTVVGSRQKVETQGILAVPDKWRKEIRPYFCEGVRTGGGSDSRAPIDDAVAESDGGKPVEVVEYRKKIYSGSLDCDPPLLAISNVSVKPGAMIVPSNVMARAAGASIIEPAMIAASTPSRIAISGFLAPTGKAAVASLGAAAADSYLVFLNCLNHILISRIIDRTSP